MKRSQTPPTPTHPRHRPTPATSAATGGPTALFLVTLALALAWGVWAASRRAWVCDDAFISFRYAANLVHGLGLVFNPGERVEGYSNFLWTVWTALGLELGADAEAWSIGWGLACHAGTLTLLGWNAWRMRDALPGARAWLPIAAVLAALHPNLQDFATSGLETSLYTFLALLGYTLIVGRERSVVRAAAAGAVFALASMTRPDGPLLAALTLAFVLAAGPRRLGRTLAFAAAFLALWVPFTLWRVAYYGDFFPNPYYAKSAAIAWYAQGWIYVRFYFARHWVIAVLAPLAAVAALLGRRHAAADVRAAAAPWERRAALAALLALGYTAYVIRVGGDFMFARMLIPVTPFYLVLVELALVRLLPRRVLAQALVTAAAAAAMTFTPSPLVGADSQDGIDDERLFYAPPVTAETRIHGLVLRPFLAGLPVRVAFLGGEARLVYYAEPAVAIESQTGLTDRFIAHQALVQRGRIGHEKVAPLPYLIEKRGCQLVFHPAAAEVLDLDSAIPAWPIELGGVHGLVMWWDPPLMEALRRRGARFDDLGASIDGVIGRLPRMADADVERIYAGLSRFYFGHIDDPARERPFLQRVERIRAGVLPKR